jgi:hypothetical protein
MPHVASGHYLCTQGTYGGPAIAEMLLTTDAMNLCDCLPDQKFGFNEAFELGN